MFTNKTGKAKNKSVLFGTFSVKLLAMFTSKTRKHNFRKACLCLLPLAAFHSQGRLFTGQVVATENETQAVR